ncbi:hypothetical protein [Algoriphagus boritolerans]|uniref:hypothetical protein n=1 Tax=Algoriphagus boritolerans TaxID=308111 RepID=UPI000A842B0D
MIQKKHLPSIALGFVVGAIGYWTADFSEKGEFSRVIYSILGPGAFICSVISFSLRKKVSRIYCPFDQFWNLIGYAFQNSL